MASPNNYSWDLGFDYSAALNDSAQYDLAMGFQLNGSSASPMINVSTGNNLFFNLFNIGPAGTYTISGVTIEFRNAVTGSGPACPFSSTQQITLGDGTTAPVQLDNAGNAAIQVGSHLNSPASGNSSIFGSNLTVWNIIPPTQMTAAGDFEVSISMVIQGPDGSTKVFTADPEMVVGSTNPDPIYDQDQPAKPR